MLDGLFSISTEYLVDKSSCPDHLVCQDATKTTAESEQLRALVVSCFLMCHFPSNTQHKIVVSILISFSMLSMQIQQLPHETFAISPQTYVTCITILRLQSGILSSAILTSCSASCSCHRIHAIRVSVREVVGEQVWRISVVGNSTKIV